MNVCIAGKNEIAVNAVNYILSFDMANLNLCVIVNQTDTGVDSWQPSLKKHALIKKIPVVNIEDLYVKKDLVFISLEYDRLIDVEKFNTKRLYNIHFSLLPEYKGAYTAVWPILEGKQYSGVTLHCIDEGIDTGKIISQIKIDINENDTSRDLYFKYMAFGYNLFKENFLLLLSNENIIGTRQSHIKSTFHSRRNIDFSNIKINIKKPAWEIHNQIRAFSFKEYQLPKIFNRSITSSRITANRSKCKFGTILNEDKNKIVLATLDYDIELYKKAYNI